MRKFLLLWLLIILPLSNSLLLAQKITVNARLDSTVMWIGSQAQLSFEVSQQANEKVRMPLFSDTIVGGLELVDKVKTDTVKSPDGHIMVTQKYTVTSFEDSLLYIPPYPFIVNGDTVWSKSLSLKVVQPFKIDTASNSITDIKTVLEPKYDWAGLIKLILFILLIIAILVVGYLLYRKYIYKKPAGEKKATEPVLPAHVVAINELNKIKQEKPWQQGRNKEYHTELTDVLREYIERIYSIKSMEMTSDEILTQLNGLRLEQKSAYTGLQQILRLADLVKFAKWNATPDEHELSLMNAYLFVNQTKIEDVKPLEEIKKEESKTVDEAK